jgi:hypothetical protein
MLDLKESENHQGYYRLGLVHVKIDHCLIHGLIDAA